MGSFSSSSDLLSVSVVVPVEASWSAVFAFSVRQITRGNTNESLANSPLFTSLAALLVVVRSISLSRNNKHISSQTRPDGLPASNYHSTGFTKKLLHSSTWSGPLSLWLGNLFKKILKTVNITGWECLMSETLRLHPTSADAWFAWTVLNLIGDSRGVSPMKFIKV